ncbi:MAG: ankyrin repeat domain-containing protein [Bacteroidia bacterium]|nr:ankyrin repeat domain-containing protein [Bacteroidia bacterium]
MFAQIQRWLERRKVIRMTGSFGAEALVRAAESGSLECVSILLAHGTDANAADPRGYPALHKSIEKGHLALTRMLYEAGANPDLRDIHGDTALIRAVRSGNLHLFSLTLEYRPEINLTDHHGESALFLAVRESNLQMVRRLLAMGAETDLLNDDGETPLMLAVAMQKTSIIKALLHAGADPNIPDAHGQTVLHRHPMSPRLSKLLRAAGANGHAHPESGRNEELLPQAALWNLLRSDAWQQMTPRLMEIGIGAAEAALQVLAAQPNLGELEQRGRTVLHEISRQHPLWALLLRSLQEPPPAPQLASAAGVPLDRLPPAADPDPALQAELDAALLEALQHGAVHTAALLRKLGAASPVPEPLITSNGAHHA